MHNAKVPWLKVPQWTVDANKEPLILRVYNTAELIIFCVFQLGDGIFTVVIHILQALQNYLKGTWTLHCYAKVIFFLSSSVSVGILQGLYALENSEYKQCLIGANITAIFRDRRKALVSK